jgi:hypothetical protein
MGTQDAGGPFRKIRRCGVRHNQSVRIGDSKVTLMVRRRKPRDHYTFVIETVADTTIEVDPTSIDAYFASMHNNTSQ